MFRLIKKIIIVLLTNIVNASNETKCLSWSNQKCWTWSSLINLHPNEYSQEIHHYQFAVKLDRCVGSCKKGYVWNPATCSHKNGKYLASIMNDSVITFDEIIESESIAL